MGFFCLWRFSFASFAGFLLFLGFCSSLEQALKYNFMHEATSAPRVSYYDYIVIGGGTAGCPLAATLSKNATVLLLERGGSPYGDPNITYLSTYPNSIADHSPLSPSQRFISEDGVINARARVLGGGTSINIGFFSRAPTEYVFAAGWDGKLVNESYRWVEDEVAFEPKIKQWQSAMRDGLLEAGVGPSNGFTYDHLIGTKVGGTIFDGEGRRHTAADLLKYANPERITVLLHAPVDQILFRINGKEKPLAHGVNFRDALGKKHTAYLNIGHKNEIILSAGAIASPQLLMLSGVGPMGQLTAHNINVVLDQPSVGQDLSDNPMNAVLIPSPSPVEVSLVQVVGITNYGGYIEGGSGLNLAAGLLANAVDMLYLKRTEEAQSQPTPSSSQAQIASPFPLGFLIAKSIGPLSKGNLELKSNKPNDNPSITFNYFKEPLDLKRCVEGLKVIESVIESKAFKPFREIDVSMPDLLALTASLPLNLLSRHDNVSTSFEQFCRDTVLSTYHYHGGCQVGKVVDSEYRVLGVDALRVVDSSTFKDTPGSNPQATVMMLGRYMGVKILKERLVSMKMD